MSDNLLKYVHIVDKLNNNVPVPSATPDFNTAIDAARRASINTTRAASAPPAEPLVVPKPNFPIVY
jgi:hypothetical protein